MTAAPPAAVVVGLDVGTTAAKAVAFGVGGPWRVAAVREYPLLQPVPGHAVQEPDVVVAAAMEALAACVAQTQGARVLAVSLSAAMHGLIGLDRAGSPVTSLVTWADARAEGEARSLHTSRLAAEVHRISGTPAHPMSPLAKLLWFARHEPDTSAAVRWWAGLKDYLLLRLTGTLATELSSASATGLLDLATGDWHPGIVEFAGIRRSQLPDVLPTTAVLGLTDEVARTMGLPLGTPVVTGAADGPLGNLGTGAMAVGTVGLSLGTSGAVRTVVPRPAPDPETGLFCYALTADHWVVGGAVSNGASVVRWAGTTLDARPWSDEALLALAGDVPAGSDGLVMLPFLLPERVPLWSPHLSGAYLGLRREHSRGHLVRAAVEGVCLQLAGIVDRLDRLAPVTCIRATGGALGAPLWRTTLAAVLNRPMVVGSAAEGSALGAAALGLYALGQADRLEDAGDLLIDPLGEQPIEPADPGVVATYAEMRHRIPVLVEALAGAWPSRG
ncbi:gluconokinase [Blastococcus mobilis]|uniref:Gluconate kinase, FGGY family n=1 Tax=Blastococcus mobilis TaxID=1938746 RepID=A0A238XEZ4_9ACTN|nr:gluconokinase [Blastococcus mobilis]SNR57252.1 gluconate kinase, FGGY family [Blastococcus mobilis]